MTIPTAPPASPSVSAPAVPWQSTGNHWLAVPCVHPADGAVHLVSVVHRASRAAVEFAGSERWAEGRGPALLRPRIVVDGEVRDLAAAGMAWERNFAWVPSFAGTVGDVAVQGTLFCPCGRDADVPGLVYLLAVENRGTAPRRVSAGVEGALGVRQLRVRSARPCGDEHRVSRLADLVLLEGAQPPGVAALALGGDPDAQVTADPDARTYAVERTLELAPGERAEVVVFLAAAAERDGAAASVAAMRRRGWRNLLGGTRDALAVLEQSTGVEALDRLVNRNLVYAYFYGVARALDDAHFYVVRSRAPWCTEGVTVRDWEALNWTIPAVQLGDAGLARELLLRVCELHGYAPGRGVSYLDGTLFQPGFSLEGAAGYAVAIDRYIRDTGDDQIVDEPVVGDTLYLVHDDMTQRRHQRYPLYSTEVGPDGAVPPFAYTLHGNAVAAQALEVLRRTLDEETARDVMDPEAVRAAMRRHFTRENGGKPTFAAAADLGGRQADGSAGAASPLWLPLYEFVAREDSTYRRTARGVLDAAASTPVEGAGRRSLVAEIARLFGPDGEEALRWLRRASLDGGLAAAVVDDEGRAVEGRGDAALAGLLAYTVWYATHALGLRP